MSEKSKVRRMGFYRKLVVPVFEMVHVCMKTDGGLLFVSTFYEHRRESIVNEIEESLKMKNESIKCIEISH